MSKVEAQVAILSQELKKLKSSQENLSKTVSRNQEQANTKFLALDRAAVVKNKTEYILSQTLNSITVPS